MNQEFKYVIIGGQKYEVSQGSQTLASVKEAAAAIDPQIASAEAYIEGDTVNFRFKAGEKGQEITKAIVENTTYAINPEVCSDPKEIKAALEQLHPSIASAEYVVNGDTMTFRFKAGEKGDK